MDFAVGSMVSATLRNGGCFLAEITAVGMWGVTLKHKVEPATFYPWASVFSLAEKTDD